MGARNSRSRATLAARPSSDWPSDLFDSDSDGDDTDMPMDLQIGYDGRSPGRSDDQYTNDWGVDASHVDFDDDDDSWKNMQLDDDTLGGWHGELVAPAQAAQAAPDDDDAANADDLAAWQQTKPGRSLASQNGPLGRWLETPQAGGNARDARNVYPFGYTQSTGNRTVMQTMRQPRGAQQPRYSYNHQTIAGGRPQRPQQYVGWIE